MSVVNGHSHPRVSRLYTIDDTAPPSWWPRAVVAAASPAVAYDRIATREDATATSVVPFAVPHRPDGRAQLLRAAPDYVEIEASSAGGVVVVQRAYQPIWQARSGERELQVLPADVVLTGVVVPPGRHRVELLVSAAPEVAAATVALLAALGLVAVAVARRSAA